MPKSYTQLAIERAIEGGWKHRAMNDKTSWRFRHGSINIIEFYKELSAKPPHKSIPKQRQNVAISSIFLDPSFWRALGKSEGWEDAENTAGNMNTPRYGICVPYEWRWHWHRFIDHLAADKDPESFFKELLSNK